MLWKGFQKPKRLACNTDTLTDKYGQFTAQPFERGFGTTIGNALRRVLLSSIEGAAITAVKIEGVLHEFSSIPGVVEDATDIILNLKQIPLKMNVEGPKTLYLNVDQPGEVTSRMIQEDADVEILDKDVYLATVSEGGKPADRDARQDRPRLRFGGEELRRRPAHRLHSGGFRALPDSQGELHGGGRAPGADDRLRQAHAGRLDERRHRARGLPLAWPPSSSKTT